MEAGRDATGRSLLVIVTVTLAAQLLVTDTMAKGPPRRRAVAVATRAPAPPVTPVRTYRTRKGKVVPGHRRTKANGSKMNNYGASRLPARPRSGR